VATYANRHELFCKADYEGGILELIFGYGLSLDDLPENDPELRQAVADVLAAGPAIERLEWMLDLDHSEECCE
jgi:hypothetical protein